MGIIFSTLKNKQNENETDKPVVTQGIADSEAESPRPSSLYPANWDLLAEKVRLRIEDEDKNLLLALTVPRDHILTGPAFHKFVLLQVEPYVESTRKVEVVAFERFGEAEHEISPKHYNSQIYMTEEVIARIYPRLQFYVFPNWVVNVSLAGRPPKLVTMFPGGMHVLEICKHDTVAHLLAGICGVLGVESRNIKGLKVNGKAEPMRLNGLLADAVEERDKFAFADPFCKALILWVDVQT